MDLVKKLSAETDSNNDAAQTWSGKEQEVVNLPAEELLARASIFFQFGENDPNLFYVTNEDDVDAPVSIFRFGETVSNLHYLNHGGEGIVYTAKVTDLGKACVKIFNKFDENSRKEAKKLLNLRGKHLNFVEVFGTYKKSNCEMGYVMELMGGGTLDDGSLFAIGFYTDMCKNCRLWAFKQLETLHFNCQVKQTVSYQKYIYRSATYMYMAPELFAENDRKKLDLLQCDIYSMGITFWEILYRRSWQENPSERSLMQCTVALQQAMEKIPDNPFSKERLYTMYGKTRDWKNLVDSYRMTMHAKLKAVRAYYQKELNYIIEKCEKEGRIDGIKSRSLQWHEVKQLYLTYTDNCLRSIVPIELEHLYNIEHTDSTPLRFDAQKGLADVIKLLFPTIGSEDNDHITPLHLAASQGNNLMVETLIIAGASVTSKDKDGRTPLHYAAGSRNTEIARTLLKHHAPIDAATVIGGTPLHFAARISNVNMVELLLQHGAIVDSEDINHGTPLHFAVIRGDNLVVEMLIAAGASLTSKHENGSTPLHYAAVLNHIECAKTLLKHRAPIDAGDNLNCTPLHAAASNGRELMVKLLLDENADPNACDCHGETPFHRACIQDMIKVVELLFHYQNTIEVTDKYGRSPLQHACFNGAIHCVTYLLKRGANPNTTAKDGSTALHLATLFNHADVVKILIQYGANVDACCKDFGSALHIASREGNVDIVTLLLKAGANPNSTNEYNETPLQIARADGHNEAAAILVKYGARKTNKHPTIVELRRKTL